MFTSFSSTSPKSVNDGVTGGYTGSSLAIRMVIACLTTLACYNALELNVLILTTFNKYKGVYFWSLLVASWGVVLYAIGFLFKFFQIVDKELISVAIITVGWWCMITGQSVVLYSRLHLILSNQKLLRRILWMIIVDAIVLHIPTTVLTFGSNASAGNNRFVFGYSVMEKIQMTGFCVQEFIISGTYLWNCAKFLRSGDEQKSRRFLYELVSINLLIIIMDLSLLGLEYANFYILEITIKGVVYSIKLKLEFAILGRLVQYVSPHSVNINDIEGLVRLESFPNSSLTTDTSRTQSFSGTINITHVNLETEQISGSAHQNPLKIPDPNEDRTGSLQRLHRAASRSEEDVETMMRQYSVKV